MQISKEKFFYYSDLPLEVLRSDIQELFYNPKRWDFSVNLDGKFTSEYEFEMTPKWQFAIITGSEPMTSYLNGILYQDNFQRTRIDFSVRPNVIFALFFVGYPLLGLMILPDWSDWSKTNDNLAVELIFIFFMPILMFILGYLAKRKIKNEFIKTFNLKPVV